VRGRCVEDWCRGLPTTFSKCLHEDGKKPFIFGVSGKGEDGSFVPSALVTTSTSLSSLGQIFLFLFLAPLADYGTLRKRFMTASTLIGGIITILMVIVRPQTYFLGPIFLVLSNMAFGVSQVVMYAYLPVLLDAMPDKLERPKICCPGGPLGVWSRLHDVQSDAEAGESSHDIERSKIIARRQRSDEISNAGFSFGYFAGMTSLIACLPLVLMVTPQTALGQPAKFMGYQLCMVLGGVWWIVFYWPTFRYLQTRPGPWPGATWCEVSCNSLKRFGTMVASVTRTRSAAQYLILWFIFSDGVHVVGSIAVLFGDAEVEWGCIPKPLGLWAMTVIGGMFAGIGSGIATRIQHFFKWQSKTMLILALCFITIIPSWSLIGILNWGYGFKQGYDMHAYPRMRAYYTCYCFKAEDNLSSCTHSNTHKLVFVCVWVRFCAHVFVLCV
jgi:MFS-type transporter involved in bile tolerance (Atg22 family)